MCIPFGETSSLAPRSRSSVKVSAEYLGHILKKKKSLTGAIVPYKHSLFLLAHLSYCDLAVSVVNFLPCVRSRGHIFSPILITLGQNVSLNKISDEFEIGSLGSKTRSLGQILEKPCVRSRGHIFSLILMKCGQNVCLDKISKEFEIGSCGVKN